MLMPVYVLLNFLYRVPLFLLRYIDLICTNKIYQRIFMNQRFLKIRSFHFTTGGINYSLLKGNLLYKKCGLRDRIKEINGVNVFRRN
jgi:hypothetical protein